MTYIGISRSAGTIGIVSDDENFEPKFFPVPITRSNGVYRLNYRQFRELLEPYAAQKINEAQKKVMAKAVMETAKTDPRHFKSTLFSTRIYEAERTVLDYLGISTQEIEPQSWEHQLFLGKYRKLSRKIASLEFGNDKWPQFKQNKADDRDGLCLAYWLKEGYQNKPK